MRVLIKIVTLVSALIMTGTAYTAPAKNYWNKWVAYNPLSEQVIHYPVWHNFLENYTTTRNGQVYVKYQAVPEKKQQALHHAIERLSDKQISHYNRNQQLAYWINLYNMETVYLVLQHYPLESIRDIKAGYFSSGPWDQKLLTVQGTNLTLNDIEHRIIRPLWNDPRIHAAVNCASISCPNLLRKPYQGQKIDQQLNEAFRKFVNSDKGVKIKGNQVWVSKIFDWYGQDFGDSPEQIKAFISAYLKDAQTEQALKQAATLHYQSYNWQLNSVAHARNNQ